jgi:hypothetical protein
MPVSKANGIYEGSVSKERHYSLESGLINNDWKVQKQVRCNMKIEKNNYRTFKQETMYKIANVKKIGTLPLHRNLTIF